MMVDMDVDCSRYRFFPQYIEGYRPFPLRVNREVSVRIAPSSMRIAPNTAYHLDCSRKHSM